MKTIQGFFEENDFTYLNLKENLKDESYIKIWEDVYLPSQVKKAEENKIPDNIKEKAFNGLSKRGYFLCQLYDYFECKNIAEVGTAEGFQFFTFCHHVGEKGTVYTCDIRDVRSPNYVEKYTNSNFIFGTSKEMAKKIIDDDKKIDLYWIDGAHHNSAVIHDVIRLAKTQSKNPIWVFDDFDERFGAYQEIEFISKLEPSFKISLGPSASGKPNTTLIVQGML